MIQTSQASIWTEAARTDCHCATEKHPAKTDHLSVACFKCEILKFIHDGVHNEKLNLHSWWIRPVFAEPVINTFLVANQQLIKYILSVV